VKKSLLASFSNSYHMRRFTRYLETNTTEQIFR